MNNLVSLLTDLFSSPIQTIKKGCTEWVTDFNNVDLFFLHKTVHVCVGALVAIVLLVCSGSFYFAGVAVAITAIGKEILDRQKGKITEEEMKKIPTPDAYIYAEPLFCSFLDVIITSLGGLLGAACSMYLNATFLLLISLVFFISAFLCTIFAELK